MTRRDNPRSGGPLGFLAKDLELLRSLQAPTGAVRACLWASGLAVLGWPLALYVAIFLFDAPTFELGGELGRWAVFLAWATYPLTFLLGLAIVWRDLKEGTSKRWHVIPAAAALLQLGVPLLLLVSL